MSVHRMPPQDEPFDPRLAALSHAAMAEQIAAGVGGAGSPSAVLAAVPGADVRIASEAASAVACGLVYVGDQIRAAVERPSALQVVLPTREAVAAWRMLEPERVPERDAGPVKVMFESTAELVRALERIRDLEEHMGSGPPEDEMREIAREALRVDLEAVPPADAPAAGREFSRYAIREEATRVLWDKRGMLPEHSEAIVEDVLDIVAKLLGMGLEVRDVGAGE